MREVTRLADRSRAKDAGFDVHLVKPVDVDDLNEALQNSAQMREKH